MKKAVWILALLTVLAGCSAPTFETMGNVVHVGQSDAEPRQTKLSLPADAAVLTASGTDMLYACADYTMSLQTLPAGDLAATVRTLSGYDASQLTVLQSQCDDHSRYDWVWVAAGEEGNVLCRAAVLDDGNYHYSLCVFADADAAAYLTETWNELYSSFCLDTQEVS